MSVIVDLAPRAVRDAERIACWWRANRLVAPRLFDEELDLVLGVIAVAPEGGTVYRSRGRLLHRRLLLPASRYHVYWRNLSPEHARVMTIWSAARGRGPRL